LSTNRRFNEYIARSSSSFGRVPDRGKARGVEDEGVLSDRDEVFASERAEVFALPFDFLFNTREQEQIAVRPEASKEITFFYLSLELKEEEELPKQTASQMYVLLCLPLGPRLRPN